MPIVLWVLRVLMAALFLFAAFAKLTSMQIEVDAFAMLPVGQWFRYLVGLLELAGGIWVLIPTISGVGAIVLLVVDVGAFFAQILFLHQDWIHPIVIGAILVALIYLQRDAIRERLGNPIAPGKKAPRRQTFGHLRRGGKGGRLTHRRALPGGPLLKAAGSPAAV